LAIKKIDTKTKLIAESERKLFKKNQIYSFFSVEFSTNQIKLKSNFMTVENSRWKKRTIMFYSIHFYFYFIFQRCEFLNWRVNLNLNDF
jgi:hypothetical protein